MSVSELLCVLLPLLLWACGPQELTIKLCQELLPPEKQEQTVTKLRRKQASAWPKVGRDVCCRAPLLLTLTTTSSEWL